MSYQVQDLLENNGLLSVYWTNLLYQCRLLQFQISFLLRYLNSFDLRCDSAVIFEILFYVTQ